MAQFPVLFRPKYLIRRRALRGGLFGPSRFWRLIAFVIIFENALTKFFGKQPERLGKRRIGVGHVITVAAYAPLTRKQRKASGITKATLEADARAEIAAAQRGVVTGVFAAGEKALLLDSKKRRYLVELTTEGEFHSHNGFVAHAAVIGEREGVVVRSTKGSEYIALRPTLEDFVVEMPRGAQVIYPKDLGPICMLADIGPGVRVFETGIGSGALSMTMLRYGADIVGYEIREDFANRAGKNVHSFLGEQALERYDVRIADSYEAIDPELGMFDRVVLDLPEPWQVVPHAEAILQPGGLLVAYTPSITQAVQVREALKGKWIDARTLEVLHRGWHIEGQAVRPDHRMVAHTAFLSVARFLGRNPT